MHLDISNTGDTILETYNILNNEILNKVSTDTHYIGLYAKLIKELIINKKWQKK